MANADYLHSRRRRNSMERLPPNFSELRVVLLGNSWSKRSSVGNLMLGETVFNTEEEPDRCLRFGRQIEEKKIVVINTPDLLHPDISEQNLTEHVKTCVRLSDPGPHVFLLVLQPEDFTMELNLRLCGVLKRFSDQSLNHSLVLTSAPYQQHPPIKDLVAKCKHRYLKQDKFEHSELLKRLSLILGKNNEQHMICDVPEDPPSDLSSDPRSSDQGVSVSSNPVTAVGQSFWNFGANWFGSGTSDTPLLVESTTNELPGLRIVLMGRSDDKKTKLAKFITGDKSSQWPIQTSIKHCVATSGDWRGKPVTVVKTSSIFSLSDEDVRKEMRRCSNLCFPGPNVLLLLVKPSEFTEENRQTLKFVLSLFGENAFRCSMVISTHEGIETNQTVNQLLEDCGGRCYNMFDSDHEQLMQKIEKIVDQNRGTFLAFNEEPENIKPSLNLVLCGRRGAGKTSAAEAILGRTDVHSVSSSSQCVRYQGDVCGRWVSLVELPALSGKPQEVAMKELFRSISLCDPEGVHAFILVLPVGPLTDEDKMELDTIQKTLSSQVSDFTMILFTVESDPKHPAVDNFIKGNTDIQKISQKYGGRSVVLNKQQIPKLLDAVEKMIRNNKPCGYTIDTFVHAQIEKNIQQEEHINTLHSELTKITCVEETQSPESLRIVLLGKTGCGKSSSGNTILGRNKFEADFGYTSVTKYCHKSESKVDSRNVVVVDTPGLFDSNLSHDQVNEEMVKCVSLLAPGPHVFLLVFRIDVRLTPEEKETLKLIKDAFGRNSEKFTIVLFTRGDVLEGNKLSIDEFIDKKCDDSFKKLISDCGGRYHVFNNIDKQNRTQVSELIKKIDTMVKENGGSYFTNELLQEAGTAIKKEMEKILKEKEEEMKRIRDELERKHKEEKEDMERRLEKQKEEIEKERKERDEQLKEMEEKIMKEREQRKKEEETREEENRKREKEEEKQRMYLEIQLELLDKQIQSEKEEKKRELEKSRDEMRQKQETWEKKQEQSQKERRREDEQRRQEEQMRITKLEEKYEKEREKSENKRKEEDQIRKEQEEKLRKELDDYKTKLETLKKTYEEEARKKAEEKYQQEFAAQKQEHEQQIKEKDKDYNLLKALSVHQKRQEINNLVKCLRKKTGNIKKITKLLDEQEKEMKSVKKEEEENLQKKHDQKMSELIKELQDEEVEGLRCIIL